MKFFLPSIFNRKNHTLDNFYRYGFLFFSFLFLFIAINVYAVYLPTIQVIPNSILTRSSLNVIFWISILFFLDSFFASIFYKKHVFYGVWRYKNTILGLYLSILLLLCTVFVLNYIFTV
ncbi:hypothetical protein COV24_05075 [candidate division WWE3 bacterium CG10_big_fil_rev_8_21_14_0_10_32_10]|uniref:Uncharacterized protein n=1 Tax=candidate division WWE3 bacterium CG10_big_fil_rev_8_21_14_0_10_32_10 TaxID=1975090 RepID=A0A2H0R942_UNCKA|nr:MAG: hypothetical protein COV24_05075 [candidate division WWE3 bacterium CG10_big_fil_rev_8_21_14_0_10_32_10]